MPDSEAISEMREKLKAKYRKKSPAGINEYVIPKAEQGLFPPFAKDEISAFTTMDYPPEIYYREDEDTPPVRTHERIHAGQFLLPNKPSTDELIDKLGLGGIKDQLAPHVKEAYELPAYAFEDIDTYPKPERLDQNRLLTRYIDIMRNLNPSGIQTLETAIPRGLMERYLRTQPVPVPKFQLPPLREHSLGWDLLRNRR